MKNLELYEEALNKALVSLFNRVMDVEEKKLITDEFHDMTNNDMHVIDSIGIAEDKKMSDVAKELSITLGTLTTSVNGLVKKGYVERERASDDKRVYHLKLTKKGENAFRHHQEFHKELVDTILEELEPEEFDIFLKAILKLEKHFYDE